jgi:excisionase family DNA binding protein
MEKELLSFKEACNYLKMATDSLYKLTAQKKIPHYKPGKRILFDKSQLDGWLEDHYVRSEKEIIASASSFTS